jgi:hypothetical protein
MILIFPLGRVPALVLQVVKEQATKRCVCVLAYRVYMCYADLPLLLLSF